MTKQDRMASNVCHELLELLEQIDHDSKWGACRDLISGLMSRQRTPVVVFTDYADTAGYLSDLSRAEGWPTHVITSNRSPQDRWDEIDRASRNRGILIATTVAAEGTNLAFTDQAIHYDLPGATPRLLDRFGRLERLGSKFGVVHHYMLIDGIATTPEFIMNLEREILEAEREFDAER